MRKRTSAVAAAILIMVGAATAAQAQQTDLSGLKVVHNEQELTAAIRAAQPGDGILLKGGEYRGRWLIDADGTADRPITLRSFPGEWARIIGTEQEHIPDNDPEMLKGVLHLAGSHWRVEHLEITEADNLMLWWRTANDRDEPTPSYGINAWGEGSVIRYTVIHDTGTAVGVWAEAKASELYGNIFYNNGVNNLDHSIYTTNDGSAAKRIEDNILLNASGHHLHAYDHDGDDVDNYEVIGNIASGGGILQQPRQARANFIFGLAPTVNRQPNPGRMADIDVVRNYLYTLAGRGEEDADLRYPDHFAGHQRLSLTGNVWLQQSPLNSGDIAGWTGVTQSSNQIAVRSRGQTLDRVIVEPANLYEQGRAHIVVFDDDGATVTYANLSGVVPAGQRIAIWNAFNPMSGPIRTLEVPSNGWIRLPLTGTAVRPATPSGMSAPPSSTAPEFAVFIVRAIQDNVNDWVSP